MAFWKQLTLSLVAIGAGILLWVWFVPGADGMLRRIGVPESVIARFAPAMQEAAAPGKGSGQAQGGNRRGGGAATLVVVQPVLIATVNDRLSALGTGDAIQSVIRRM